MYARDGHTVFSASDHSQKFKFWWKSSHALVVSKTKIALIKQLSIPRLELCGAQVLVKLLCHVKKTLTYLPPRCSHGPTAPLSGNPWRFKTFLGNWISHILPEMEASPRSPKSSRLWFQGFISSWTQGLPTLVEWTSMVTTQALTLAHSINLLWMCPLWRRPSATSVLSVIRASHSSISILKLYPTQESHCLDALLYQERAISNKGSISSSHCLRANYSWNLLAKAYSAWEFSIGGWKAEGRISTSQEQQATAISSILGWGSVFVTCWWKLINSKLSFSQSHPVILEGKHSVTKLLIRSEHIRLMHAACCWDNP